MARQVSRPILRRKINFTYRMGDVQPTSLRVEADPSGDSFQASAWCQCLLELRCPVSKLSKFDNDVV